MNAPPAELDLVTLTRRFKPRRNYKAPRLENADYSEADVEVVVLCAMQTLLSPQEIPALSNTLNGQPPCEAYFIVVAADNPSKPLLERGFVFVPERRHFCQKKTALQNLEHRIKAVHGIDPNKRGLVMLCRDRLQAHRQRLQNQNPPNSAGGDEADDYIFTSELSVVVSQVFQPVLDIVHRNKTEVGSTCLFLTTNDSSAMNQVKLSLKWLFAQSEVKPFRCAIHNLSDVFPGVSDEAGQTFEDRNEHRCVLHSVTNLMPGSSKPYRECSKLLARRLWASLSELAAAIDEAEPPETAGDLTTTELLPLPKQAEGAATVGSDVAPAGQDLKFRVDASLARLQLPFFMNQESGSPDGLFFADDGYDEMTSTDLFEAMFARQLLERPPVVVRGEIPEDDWVDAEHDGVHEDCVGRQEDGSGEIALETLPRDGGGFLNDDYIPQSEDDESLLAEGAT